MNGGLVPQNDVLTTLSTAGPRLLALLTRLTLRPDLAEELIQELFLNLARSPAFRKANDPTAYAFQAAIHLAMKARQQRLKRFAQLPADLTAATVPPLESLVRGEQADQVLAALAELSAQARDAAVLHFIEQRSYEEIAAAMNKSPHQVRGLCHDALRQLRVRFQVSNPEELSHD